MFHVTWNTFKFNRNQQGTFSAYVMSSVPWSNRRAHQVISEKLLSKECHCRTKDHKLDGIRRLLSLQSYPPPPLPPPPLPPNYISILASVSIWPLLIIELVARAAPERWIIRLIELQMRDRWNFHHPLLSSGGEG